MELQLSDKDILKTEITLNFDDTPSHIELFLQGEAWSIKLTRDDVIALAKEFDIIRLI